MVGLILFLRRCSTLEEPPFRSSVLTIITDPIRSPSRQQWRSTHTFYWVQPVLLGSYRYRCQHC